jgi:hypothetical protein
MDCRRLRAPRLKADLAYWEELPPWRFLCGDRSCGGLGQELYDEGDP